MLSLQTFNSIIVSADPELKESVFPWKSFGESRSHKKCIMEGLPIDAVDLGKGLDRMTTSEINILVNGIENGTIRIRKVEWINVFIMYKWGMWLCVWINEDELYSLIS